MRTAWLIRAWAQFWMRYSGLSRTGRLSTRLAGWLYPPYKGQYALAKMCTSGYVSPSACIYARNLTLGNHVFLGDGVTIFDRTGSPGASAVIGDEVYINKGTIIELGKGGSLSIGDRTTIQPHCQFSAYTGTIQVGADVQIAPNCAFYPYGHGMAPDKLMNAQPLVSKGGIVVEDDVWLGYGVIVLDGVRIGKGAVIGAGSVVNQDVPSGAVAVGVPVRVVKSRYETTAGSDR
jgi:acetyltransferase-like isoleucine patch superfamily enzyme